MELPEIIGSTILLFSTIIILLFTFSYLVYKLKNQTRLQPGFSNFQEFQTKVEQVKVEDLGKDQLSKPVFSNVDDRVIFNQIKVTRRFEIVNQNFDLKNNGLEERKFN
jgi:hypothetical protein